MPGELSKWMAGARIKEKNMMMNEEDRELEQIVQGTREWCDQAASSVAAAEGREKRWKQQQQ